MQHAEHGVSLKSRIISHCPPDSCIHLYDYTIFEKFRTSKCSSSGCRCHDVPNTSCHRPDCLYGCMQKYHKPGCTSLPEDEHLDVRNMSKTL